MLKRGSSLSFPAAKNSKCHLQQFLYPTVTLGILEDHFSLQLPLIIKNENHFCNRTVKSYTYSMLRFKERSIWTKHKTGINPKCVELYCLYYNQGTCCLTLHKIQWKCSQIIFFFLTPKYSLFTERKPKEKFSHETLNFPFFNLLDLVAVVENTPVSSVGSSFFHH